MSETLSQQLDEFLAGWMQRVPADRRAAMERHIAHLSETREWAVMRNMLAIWNHYCVFRRSAAMFLR